MQRFGAPVVWKPAAIVALFVLWLALSSLVADWAAIVITVVVGLALLLGRPLLRRFRDRRRAPR